MLLRRRRSSLTSCVNVPEEELLPVSADPMTPPCSVLATLEGFSRVTPFDVSAMYICGVTS